MLIQSRNLYRLVILIRVRSDSGLFELMDTIHNCFPHLEDLELVVDRDWFVGAVLGNGVKEFSEAKNGNTSFIKRTLGVLNPLGE